MTELKPISEILPFDKRRRDHGRPTPDEAPLSERDQLVLDLIQVGVGFRKAESLVSHFAESLIRKQLSWLPLRAARRPASLLIAAIEHDYDAPVYADER